MFSAVVGFNWFTGFVAEVVEEMFVAWKYCIKVMEVIFENKIFGY